ncbi:MAG: hypothetical protein AAGI52_00355 [Bacteroidota bacterium]
MTVHVHIDRIVLDGLGPLNADAVGAAVQTELARLLIESGTPAEWTQDYRQRRADGGQFRLGESAEGVGRQVAQRVFTSLQSHE